MVLHGINMVLHSVEVVVSVVHSAYFYLGVIGCVNLHFSLVGEFPDHLASSSCLLLSDFNHLQVLCTRGREEMR